MRVVWKDSAPLANKQVKKEIKKATKKNNKTA